MMNEAALRIEGEKGHLSGDLTFATVSGLHRQMQSARTKPHSISLEDVERIDSAGLALLLEWQSAFKAQANTQGLIRFDHPPQALLSIAQLCDAGQYLVSDTNNTREHE